MFNMKTVSIISTTVLSLVLLLLVTMVFDIGSAGLQLKPGDLFAFGSAVIAILGAAITIYVALANAKLVRTNNAFETGRRWDSDPNLKDARRRIRAALSKNQVIGRQRSASEYGPVKEELIDLFNFYWDLDRAIRYDLVTEPYLRDRFSPSLSNFVNTYPCFFVQYVRPQYQEAYENVVGLAKRWELDIPPEV